MVSSGKPCNIDSDIVWDPLLFFTSWTANSRRIRYKNISEDCIRKRASLQQNDLKLSPLSFQSSKRERSKEPHSKSFPIALVGLSNEEEINHRLIECNLAENAFPELPFFATELYRAMPYPYPFIASLVPRNGYNWNCFFLLGSISLWSAIHGNHSCCRWLPVGAVQQRCGLAVAESGLFWWNYSA